MTASRALLRRGRSALVAAGESRATVCRRTGAILSTNPPSLEFEGQQSARAPAPSTVEESVWQIERALAEGKLQATEAVKTGLRLLRKDAAREEELMLQDYAYMP